MTAHFDAGLYRWVTHLAQQTPVPLDDAVRFFSDYGLGLFAVLMLLAWWRARPGDAARMATALAAPLVVLLVFLVNDAVKSLFDEQRPCQTIHVATVEPCPGLGDWSFPSNHTAIATACAVALLVANRRLGLVAVPVAVLMAASRVWIGVHYPHDVLAALVVGAAVAWPAALAARRAAPAVERMRGTRLLGPALGRDPAGAPAGGTAGGTAGGAPPLR
ncbi:phosphatase PAP2 family protein [Actinacidiphila rubida]|uniref:Undecaprenyl-diphosphatase n=1 Tax=Actinacidiphila rubida TaxID=310780 RepID=A0A1H8DES5_9ACTN|nr:phosphatase PAP2 family protein [Actinacidiphila rubida]SEN04997.1 undecaprenyl-diphosphatase [Actinacidiphila rubida]